jgi:translation initiation factor IF-2
MPVRIYDISKKLGLENKEILAKARAMGIAAAKVPSSSLDKITAEDLEHHLLDDHPEIAAKFAAPPVIEPPKPAPVEEKVVFITAPPPPAPEPQTGEIPASTETQKENAGSALTPAGEEPEPAAPPPPKPAAPKVGDKVGFVQLPTRPQPRGGEKPGPPKLPPPRQTAPPRSDSRSSRRSSCAIWPSNSNASRSRLSPI